MKLKSKLFFFLQAYLVLGLRKKKKKRTRTLQLAFIPSIPLTAKFLERTPNGRSHCLSLLHFNYWPKQFMRKVGKLEDETGKPKPHQLDVKGNLIKINGCFTHKWCVVHANPKLVVKFSQFIGQGRSEMMQTFFHGEYSSKLHKFLKGLNLKYLTLLLAPKRSMPRPRRNKLL